ncbi:MAG: DUF4190 domain-containing protein [Lachnospiraceae bacterium]|nr:DUF4190 domain-containing protein [Lachnospiraceae bacterium]
MDNQNNNEDFLYGGNEQPVNEYEETVVENENIIDVEPEPQASEPEPQQLPPYGQEAFNQNQYGQFNNYNQNPYQQNAYNPYEQQNTKKTLGIISLVTGILSVTCCCMSEMGIVFGIAALITGIISNKKKENAKGLAIAGIIMGSIAIFLGIIGVIIGAYLVSTGVYDNLLDEFSQSFINGYNSFPSDLDY